MHKMRVALGLVLGVAMIVGAVACGDDDDDGGGATPPADDVTTDNVLSITERDYEFAISGDVAAGTVSIAVDNEGSEFHELAMGRLVEGKTVDDVRAALEAAGPESEADFDGILEGDDTRIDDLGGVQLPGTAYTITGSEIPAGDYAVMCFIPNAEGVPHWQLGMLADFTIAEGDVATGPEASVSYTATAEGLEGPDALSAGETTIAVVNDSPVSREITLMKLKEGATAEDVGAWFESGGDGAPDPAESPLDFMTFVFDAEQDRRITVDLVPGQWFLEVPDPENPFEGPPTENPHAVLITVT